jgi:hypothetical protein
MTVVSDGGSGMADTKAPVLMPQVGFEIPFPMAQRSLDGTDIVRVHDQYAAQIRVYDRYRVAGADASATITTALSTDVPLL